MCSLRSLTECHLISLNLHNLRTFKIIEVALSNLDSNKRTGHDLIPPKILKSASRPMAKESNKNFPNSDLMLAFGLEIEGNSQNQKQPKSKTMKENEEGSSKKRRFAVVETRNLDVLIKDSLAKK